MEEANVFENDIKFKKELARFRKKSYTEEEIDLRIKNIAQSRMCLAFALYHSIQNHQDPFDSYDGFHDLI